MSGYTIPYVTTRSDRGGERTVDIYSRLLADRIVYLGTAIDDGVANAVIAQLLHLANENSDTPIALYLNSPGGSLPATLAIYDAMQFVRPRVETTCVGQAAASAALLLAGGAPGGRQILPHGRVVIHAPAAEGRGTIPDLILEADEVARVRLLQEELLARHTGRTPEQIRSDLERDLILTPAEAVRFGVVDRVLTPAESSGGQADGSADGASQP
ncbi:MAG: ATP-dependent Clp protease proteolytic subunit [Micropruina sp.]|nr:ATP-dependent Clp protease proteolytic subunit [Micropruina sp.]